MFLAFSMNPLPTILVQLFPVFQTESYLAIYLFLSLIAKSERLEKSLAGLERWLL